MHITKPSLRSLVATLIPVIVFALAIAPLARAHSQAEPSFHDSMAATKQRLTNTLGAIKLADMSIKEVHAALTAEERYLLGSTFIHFHISQPARVHVLIQAVNNADTFWLAERGFTRDEGAWRLGVKEYQTWSRVFPAGDVGLGTPSLSGKIEMYAVVITPEKPGAPAPVVDELYPGRLRVAKVELKEPIHVDTKEKLTKAPDRFIGQTIIRTLNKVATQGQLQGLYHLTQFPSSAKPDHITLTWTGEPSTTQTVRWRTNATVTTGTLAYAKGDLKNFSPRDAKKITAATEALDTPDVANDPRINFHTAALTGLEPATSYTYAIANSNGTWTAPATFTTAPGKPASFSFIYLGDAQYGFLEWGKMMRGAVGKRPDAAFVIMAGDIVTRGQERDNWDDFFNNATGIFTTRPVVPVVGNHEYHGGEPELYLRHFAIRHNGPKNVGPGLAYSFEYGNALVVVLNSNRDIPEQAEWLEEQLKNTKALWKFVSYHHPAYASKPGRNDNAKLKPWLALFDKYHVDLALQGHDHAYLRTYPMQGDKRVATPKDGTIYIVSVSGTKLYEQSERDYTEVGFAKVPTWQILDLTLEDRTLRYRAYDADGKMRDEFVITK